MRHKPKKIDGGFFGWGRHQTAKMTQQYSVNEIRCALLQLMRKLWNEYQETGRDCCVYLVIESEQRKEIVEWYEKFIDDWNDERNTEVVYYIETADLEEDDFKSKSREYRLQLTERHQDYDFPNFDFQIDKDVLHIMYEGYIGVKLTDADDSDESDDEEDSTLKECKNCRNDSSCGNYNEDKEWICEDCEQKV